ncbi:amino acid permease [Aspergillus luchuensis]|uniref:Amino acid permease n=1 Tax=Aspergillus kawachii TaxID=1069201 RepID=A0A146FFL5_ASPKA|nr:amino acid permease [Aspergillus luchuensis]
MSFKHGAMAIQELGSRQYKDRDDADMAKFGRKQRFEAEKLRVPVDAGLHNHDDVYLGGSPYVSVNISTVECQAADQ